MAIKPIKIVCTYPAGGLTDIFARAYGEYVAEKTGQPVIGREQGGRGRARSVRRSSSSRRPTATR